MCLDKFPVEFDDEGNARLSDSIEADGTAFLEDVTVPEDELTPEERFGAIVEELPDRAVQRLTTSEATGTSETDESTPQTP
jgi:hypothetical protein